MASRGVEMILGILGILRTGSGYSVAVFLGGLEVAGSGPRSRKPGRVAGRSKVGIRDFVDFLFALKLWIFLSIFTIG